MIFKPFPDNDITRENRLYIEEIQQILRILELYANGESAISVDGIFGPATTAAIKNFQIKHGLDVTGVVDRNTFDKIVAEYTLLNDKRIAEVPIFAFRPRDSVAFRTGDSGDAVYFLNIMLNSIATVFKNIPFPTLNNMYTDETTIAVSTLQRLLGLASTGVTDRRTWNRITALYNDLVYDLTTERNPIV